MNQLIKHAVHHSLHCLFGCGLGEICGMLIASSFDLHKVYRLIISICLAFIFGYTLTYRSVVKDTNDKYSALRITLITDTASILLMELIDSTTELLVPNALIVKPDSFRFWWGLALALSLAFIAVIPLNASLINKRDNKTIV